MRVCRRRLREGVGLGDKGVLRLRRVAIVVNALSAAALDREIRKDETKAKPGQASIDSSCFLRIKGVVF